jgi:hypothetical protein
MRNFFPVVQHKLCNHQRYVSFHLFFPSVRKIADYLNEAYHTVVFLKTEKLLYTM